MSLNVVASEQACGAEITGIDLKKDLSESQISEIRNHWLKYHILSFPNQALSDDDLERLLFILDLLEMTHLLPQYQVEKILLQLKEQQMKRYQFLQTIGTLIGVFKKIHQQVHVYLEK